jgi:hypothetical protein
MSMIKQKGTSTVEFAMVLPLLLLLIVMVSEFGIMFYRLNALTKSVQDAARYLSDVSVNKNFTGANATSAKNLAVYGNTAGTGSAIVPGLTPANIVPTDLGDHVQVVATYDIFSDSFILGLGNSLNGLLSMATGSAPIDFTGIQFQKASSVMRFAQ